MLLRFYDTQSSKQWCVCTKSNPKHCNTEWQNPHQSSQRLHVFHVKCVWCSSCLVSDISNAFWRGLNTLLPRSRHTVWILQALVLLCRAFICGGKVGLGLKSRDIWINLYHPLSVFYCHYLSLSLSFYVSPNSLSLLPRLILRTERLPPFVFISI